jgi:hypothetical protein
MPRPINSKPQWCRAPLPYPGGTYGKYSYQRYVLLRGLPHTLASECWEAASTDMNYPGLGVPSVAHTPCAGQEPTDVGQNPAEADQKPAEASPEPADAGQEPANAGQEPAAAGKETADAGQEVFKGVPGVSIWNAAAAAATEVDHGSDEAYRPVSPFATITGRGLAAAVRGGTTRATVIWTSEPPEEVRQAVWGEHIKWLQLHGRWELNRGAWVYRRLW